VDPLEDYRLADPDSIEQLEVILGLPTSTLAELLKSTLGRLRPEAPETEAMAATGTEGSTHRKTVVPILCPLGPSTESLPL
jgi:hypothetical protein